MAVKTPTSAAQPPCMGFFFFFHCSPNLFVMLFSKLISESKSQLKIV